MKKIFTLTKSIVLLACITLFMSSCNKEQPSEYVGTWSLVESISGDDIYYYESGEFTMTINADGTCYVEPQYICNWRVKDNLFYLTEPESGDDETFVYEIINIDSKTLTWKEIGYYDDTEFKEHTYGETQTYKKIK